MIFYIVFILMGQFCDDEVRSACGHADAVVKTRDYIYVFEFKLNGSVDEALQQIDGRGYLIPYAADGRSLVKVGVSFDATIGTSVHGKWRPGNGVESCQCLVRQFEYQWF